MFSKNGLCLCTGFLAILVPDQCNVRPMNECSNSFNANGNDTKTISILDGESEKEFMIRVNDSIRDDLRYGWN